MSTDTTSKADIYTRVTDTIIAALERGVRPWQPRWTARGHDGHISRPLRVTGEPYRGINVLMLWGAAEEKGYRDSRWMTFRQALELGAAVRKGERSTEVVYASSFVKRGSEGPSENAGDGQVADGEDRAIFFLKGYHVFNVEQIDGLPEKFSAAAEAEADDGTPEARIAAAEAFVKATGAAVKKGGARAYYAPLPDFIKLPAFKAFVDASAYYATLLHELTHWTGHATRCDRPILNRPDTHGYAREELVAEIGAAFLCGDLGVAAEPREDHATYLANYLALLKADKRAIFQASTAAQKAADFLHGLQPAAAR
ncbi:MAG TPA: zincin-like metallopeptidase domain-containing protein [Isosphaeraceae bacterium]|jgi:antirestriction protein ArdC